VQFLAPSTPPTTLRGALDTAAAAANAPAEGIAANDTADAIAPSLGFVAVGSNFETSADFPLAILSSEPSSSPCSPPDQTSLSWHHPHQTSFSKGSSHRNMTTPTKTEPTTTRISTDGGVQSRRRVSDTTIKLDLWERGGGACANNDDDDYDERTGAKNTQQRNRGRGCIGKNLRKHISSKIKF